MKKPRGEPGTPLKDRMKNERPKFYQSKAKANGINRASDGEKRMGGKGKAK